MDVAGEMCATLEAQQKPSTGHGTQFRRDHWAFLKYHQPSIPLLPSAIKATQNEISMMQEWARAHRFSV